jgi:uncharacterized protein
VSGSQDVPECVSCGVCCFSTLDEYVDVRGDDHARLGDDADALVVFHGTRAYMKMHDGHCAALTLRAQDARFECAVYPRRPRVCRELERGSGQCMGEITTKGARPLVALRHAR